MNTIKKQFPAELAHSVFFKNEELQKINKLDYDLYIWLIYKIDLHLKYNPDDKVIQFSYSEVKDEIPYPSSTQIKSSLLKLDNIEIITNVLQSYRDIKSAQYNPFKINIVTEDNGRSYYFEVTPDKDFINKFKFSKNDEYNPFVKVDYNTLYNLNKMSKFLYVLLKNRVGDKKKETGTFEIEDLKLILNLNTGGEVTNFTKYITKAIKDINDNAEINITSCAINRKFNKNHSVEFVIEAKQEKEEEIITSSGTVDGITREQAVDKETNKRYNKSNKSKIVDKEAYKRSIQKNVEKTISGDEWAMEAALEEIDNS